MEALTYLAIVVVSALITQAMMPRPEKPRPAELANFDAPTAEEGKPIPVVFGTVRVTGPNVLWYGDLYTESIKSGGGKK